LIGLREGLCVVFDDDSVVVFASGRVADRVKEKIENAVSRNVLEFIDELVRAFFVRFVYGNALKTDDPADGDGSIFLVPDSVVRYVVDTAKDELGPAAGSGRTGLGRLQPRKRSAVAVTRTPCEVQRARPTRLRTGSTWR
jgi:hypothetical protein